MDLKQLEYIVTIDDEQSISKAAEKLYITQSALNQQLLKLERELGTPLFERRHHLMIPTFAGRQYLNTARQMLSMKRDTYKIIHDISDDKTGEISIAYTPERGALMFSNIYPVFHKKYPNIAFHIMEARVKRMEQLLLRQDVTMALITYSDDFKLNPAFDTFDTGKELMILGIPSSHPLAVLGGEESYKTFPEIDLNLLRDEQFVLMSQETRFRDMINLAFTTAGFKPHILFESASSFTIVNMVRQQVCPAFFPQSYVEPDAPVTYFTVKPHQSWTRCFAYLRGTYITKPEQYLMQLAREYNIRSSFSL